LIFKREAPKSAWLRAFARFAQWLIRPWVLANQSFAVTLFRKILKRSRQLSIYLIINIVPAQVSLTVTTVVNAESTVLIWLKMLIICGRPAQHTAHGSHAARESFRNCRKCSNSPTSDITINCRSRICFKLQQNDIDFATHGKFMWSIWPFVL